MFRRFHSYPTTFNILSTLPVLSLRIFCDLISIFGHRLAGRVNLADARDVIIPEPKQRPQVVTTQLGRI